MTSSMLFLILCSRAPKLHAKTCTKIIPSSHPDTSQPQCNVEDFGKFLPIAWEGLRRILSHRLGFNVRRCDPKTRQKCRVRDHIVGGPSTVITQTRREWEDSDREITNHLGVVLTVTHHTKTCKMQFQREIACIKSAYRSTHPPTHWKCAINDPAILTVNTGQTITFSSPNDFTHDFIALSSSMSTHVNSPLIFAPTSCPVDTSNSAIRTVDNYSLTYLLLNNPAL